MAISPSKPTPILLLLLTITLNFSSSTTTSNILSSLHSLRSNSPSNIIHLNETILTQIFTSGPRSFHLIIFFDAIQLHDKPEPNLKTIKSQFTLISKSISTNNQNTTNSNLSKIFFCDIEFNGSEKLFVQFGIQALPNIKIVPPELDDLQKSDSIPLQYSSNLAESIAEFIESKTGVSIGKIHRAPIISRAKLGFLILGFVISIPFLMKKVVAGETPFHSKKIWIFGVLFVYFFSVSGSMFILIRRIPMFVVDRKDPNRLVFFYKGTGTQFGSEGVCVGVLFMIVGLLLAFVTRVVVRIKDGMIQRGAMGSAMVVCFWAVREVVGLNHWKTGYFAHAYLPSSWYK